MTKEDEEWMNAPMGTPKQQPPASDFTKKDRESIFLCSLSDLRARTVEEIRLIKVGYDLCDRLDSVVAINDELLTACKRMLGAMSCDELNNGRVFDDDLRKEVKNVAEAAIAKAQSKQLVTPSKNEESMHK